MNPLSSYWLRVFLLACAVSLPSAAPHAESRKVMVVFADAIPELPVATTVAIDRAVGTGAVAEPEMFIVMHYQGWVYDAAAPDHKGLKFDSSIDRGPPFSVLHGVGRMITGLDKGIEGMRVGGKRTLVIPSTMGYGNRLAFGEVPPDSTLIFEVELLDVVPQQNVR